MPARGGVYPGVARAFPGVLWKVNIMKNPASEGYSLTGQTHDSGFVSVLEVVNPHGGIEGFAVLRRSVVLATHLALTLPLVTLLVL